MGKFLIFHNISLQNLNLAKIAKNVQTPFKPLLVMLFTLGRGTGNSPHIGLKALNEKIDDPLKPHLEVGLKAVLKSLTRFSVPMFSFIQR
jgi:hypothetical protein